MVKIERTFPAPKSLAIEAKKASGSYSEPDVIEQLKKDFHNKCYICGMNNLQDPQVEHRLPHMNGKYLDRKFDWNNLFWACSHCNNVKNQRIYDQGIIDCCIQDPELLLRFSLREEDVVIKAQDMKDDSAVLTAKLIMEVYNLRNTGMRKYKSAMRLEELTKEMNKLYDALEEVVKNPESGFAQMKLKALLRRESRFAAFKRGYIRENKSLYNRFMDYII